MTIYFFKTGLEARGGTYGFSETTKPRKPLKGVKRWHITDDDRHPLGPLPSEAEDRLNAHWCLMAHKKGTRPNVLNTIEAKHMSGLQALRPPVADIFIKFGGPDVQVIKIPKIWSRSEDQEVTEPYYLVNVYGAEEAVDLEASKATEVVNPRMGQPFWADKHCKLRPGFQTTRQLWRDKNTSLWFCGDDFRAAIEAVEPTQYEFIEKRPPLGLVKG